MGSVRKDVNVAVQNLWASPKGGAYTGELTADLVKDFGIQWTILGHSERRSSVAAESAELVGTKVQIALEAGLNVIACVGESLDERENGRTMEVVKQQLGPIVQATLAAGGEAAFKSLVIAYEPVWAIGTGKTASPDQANAVHADIRAWLGSMVNPAVANDMHIIYGGSVKAANCDDLVQKPDIDGFLVGGASLKDEFLKIIQSAALVAKM